MATDVTTCVRCGQSRYFRDRTRRLCPDCRHTMTKQETDRWLTPTMTRSTA